MKGKEQLMDFGESYFRKLKEQGTDCNYKGTWQKMYVYFLNKVFGLKGKTILDLGCAMGAITSTFKDYGNESIGVDISGYAKEKSNFKNFKFINTPCWDLKEIKDNTIEFVHSMFMFNFIPEDKILSTFSEIKRVCKQDTLVFTILNMSAETTKNKDGSVSNPKYFWDSFAGKESLKDGTSGFYTKLMSVKVPGWDFMKEYQWPYLLYKVAK